MLHSFDPFTEWSVEISWHLVEHSQVSYKSTDQAEEKGRRFFRLAEFRFKKGRQQVVWIIDRNPCSYSLERCALHQTVVYPSNNILLLLLLAAIEQDGHNL